MSGHYVLAKLVAADDVSALSRFEAGGDVEAKVRAGDIVRDALDASLLRPDQQIVLTREDHTTVVSQIAARFTAFGQP